MPSREPVEILLTAYPPQVQEVAEAARRLIQEALPDIGESADESDKLISYHYGKGYKGVICTLIMSKKGVKLGIYRGSELPDPKHLMAGPGKVHRYVQLKSVTDLKQPGLKQLLKAAVTAWRSRASASG